MSLTGLVSSSEQPPTSSSSDTSSAIHTASSSASSSSMPLKSGIAYTNCFNQLNQTSFEFQPPEEAPIFRPTSEEFAKGPLNYIAKIRNQAEKYGICKIIPPPDFQPPFTVNVEKFRFTPRVQRLNELEAQTRVKLNFLEQVIKYWDLQGQQIKIPSIDKRLLDLYGLYKAVESEGGFEACVRDKKWSVIATKLGLINTSHNKGTLASLIRHHYEKILYPFDLFVQGVLASSATNTASDDLNSTNDLALHPPADKRVKLNADGTKTESERPVRVSPRRSGRRLNGCQENNLNSPNKEQTTVPLPIVATKLYSESSEIPECKRCSSTIDQIDLVKCSFCRKHVHIYCLMPPLSDVPKTTWNCPECISMLFQTQPQAYTQEFGFAQSQRSYSLAEFGEIADQFKTDYFKTACHLIPLDLVEKEFWRLVSSIEDMVSVEYGADLHTFDFGSGFPTKDAECKRPEDAAYVDHPWNLNNLPVLESSVFKYINTDINGMIIPWMYVGMCFSTFCWHNEDHWSYSINYLHWGEVKTWYGVPGSAADRFETAMKQSAPELFASQPDLLHQLVTICNPNLLQSRGVPIYRTNQHAGEFVVTFPRAYHAGFNQGLNFAEAVNFSPADWISLGRDCMVHYKRLHRFPVFSHDELVCKMANDPDLLDIELAKETYDDLQRMIHDERQARERLLKLGVTQSRREIFELLPDDERQCEYCKTTCFLSAVSCACSRNKLVCANHLHRCCSSCELSELMLRYRYTLDELPLMLVKPKQRIDAYQSWLSDVQQVLDSKMSTENNSHNSVDKCNQTPADTALNDDKPTLSSYPTDAMSGEQNSHRSKHGSFEVMHLKKLVVEAKRNNFPLTSPQMEQLISLIDWSRNISNVCESILQQQRRLDVTTEQARRSKLMRISKHSKRSTSNLEDSSENRHHYNRVAFRSPDAKATPHHHSQNTYYSINNKLKMFEFIELVDEVKELPCKITEHDAIIELCERVIDIQKAIEHSLRHPSSNIDSAFLEELIERAESIANVDFGKSLTHLKYKHEELLWLEECALILSPVDDLRKKKHQIDVATVQKLIFDGESLTLYTKSVQDQLRKLSEIIEQFETWTAKAKQVLHQSTTTSIESWWSDEDQVFLTEEYQKLPTSDLIDSLLAEADRSWLLAKFNLNPFYDELFKIAKESKHLSNEITALLTSATSENLNTTEVDDDQLNSMNEKTIEMVESLFEQARKVRCQLEQMPRLAHICRQMTEWRNRMHRAFIKKASLYRLSAVLLPRARASLPASIDMIAASSKVLFHQLKKLHQISTSSAPTRKNNWFDKLLNGNRSDLSVCSAYRNAERLESVCMKEIREKNFLRVNSTANSSLSDNIIDLSKRIKSGPKEDADHVQHDERSEDDGGRKIVEVDDQMNVATSDQETEEDACDREVVDAAKQKFCICGKHANDWMIQCQLCADWFHVNCVQSYSPLLTSIFSGKRKNSVDKHGSSFLLEELDTRKHFLYVCILCARGKRPTLEQAHELLDLVRQLPQFHVIERQLLACLISRAQKFQRRVAHEIAQRPPFALAYEQLRKHLYMDTNLAKTQNSLQSPSTGKKAIHRKTASARADCDTISGDAADSTRSIGECKQTDGSHKSTGSPKTLSTKKKRSISQQVRNAIIALDDETRAIIRDLLFEGCLLELSVDETHVLWVMSVLDEPVEPTAIFISPKCDSMLPLQNQYFTYKPKVSSFAATASSSMARGPIAIGDLIGCNHLESTSEPSARSNNTKKRRWDSVHDEDQDETSNGFNKNESKEQAVSTVSGVCNKRERKEDCGSRGGTSKMSKSDKQVAAKQMLERKKSRITKATTADKSKASVAQSAPNSESESEAEVCLQGAKCLLPHDEEVDWVFCEGDCQGWYHVRCVGLQSGVQLPHDEKFYCAKCQSTQQDRKCASNQKCCEPSFDNVHWIQCDGACKLWFHQICVGFEDPKQVAQLTNFYCVACSTSSEKQS